MNSWGTYGIRISNILDRVPRVGHRAKRWLLQGYLVDEVCERGGFWVAERSTPLLHRKISSNFYVIFGGTILHTDVVGKRLLHGCATIQRGYAFDTGWSWALDRAAEPVSEDDTIDTWLSRIDFQPSHFRSPIGLPWEIARIVDPVARLSAIQAYEASL